MITILLTVIMWVGLGILYGVGQALGYLKEIARETRLTEQTLHRKERREIYKK